MAEPVSDFHIKKITTFVLIYNASIELSFAILKNARKICFTRKWNFTTIFKKRIWVKTEFVPVLYIVWGKTFCFEVDCIHENIVWPANENFTSFFKKHVYESWRCSFKAFILKKVKYLWLDLHYVHKEEMGQRHTWKRSKNLFYPQMKILQQSGYNTLNPTPPSILGLWKYFLI